MKTNYDDVEHLKYLGHTPDHLRYKYLYVPEIMMSELSATSFGEDLISIEAS